MNYATSQGNVTYIEREMRVSKEMFRALYHQLTYKDIPKVMVRYGLKDMVKWLSMFPPKGGVSKTYIPREILILKPVDYTNIPI